MARPPALAAILILALAGCAQPPPGPWHGRDLSETDPAWARETLPPGGGLELDYVRGRGTELAWDWFVEERVVVGFMVHAHQGGGLRVFVDGNFTDHAGSLTAEASGFHSLLWTNHGDAPLTLWHRTPEGAQRTAFGPPP